MAIKIFEKFAPRANPADGDYPYGSIKNESVPGAKDGTPLDAVWGNDYAGFDAALLAEAGIVPSGLADTVGTSQRLLAVGVIAKNNSNVGFTLNQAINDNTIKELQTRRITDRGDGLFDVVQTSTVTPNGYNIIQSAVIPSLSLSLRLSRVMRLIEWGVTPTTSGAVNSDIIDLATSKLRSYAFGGDLIFPAFEFLVLRAISLYSQIRYIGQGEGITIIKADPLSDDNVMGNSGMEFDIPSAWNVIRDLTIDGNKTNVSYNTRSGGFADDAYQSGIRLFKVTDYLIENVTVRNTVFNGISVYFSSNRGRIVDCTVNDIGKGETVPVGGFASYMGIFVEYACNDLTIINPRIFTVREIGIMMQIATDGSIFDINIINPQISSIRDQGIAVRDQGPDTTGDIFDITIIGGQLRNCCTGGATTSQAAYRVERQTVGKFASNIKMIGTTISDSGYIGALLNTGSKDCLMSGVTVKGSADKGIIDAGQDNELNSTSSYGNVGANLDTSSSGSIRIIGGRYGDNIPNDGESGSFTPLIKFAGNTSGTGTFEGDYRVDGGFVHFGIKIILTSKGVETGDLSISGLPFTSDATMLTSQSLAAANVTYAGELSCLSINGTDELFMYDQVTGLALTRLTDSNMANDSELYISGSYKI